MRLIGYSLALLGLCVFPASAATLIESRTDEGTQKMWVEGTRARVESDAGVPGYILMDFSARELLFVNDREKTIVAMGGQFSSEPPPEVSGAHLTKVGPGPEIAGYDTTHYRLEADGHVCSDSYVSEAVIKEANLEELVEAAKKIYSPPQAVNGIDPCARAEAAFEPKLIEKGFVLRNVKNGEIKREVTSVQTGVDLPPGGLGAPASYELLDMAEMQRRMMEKLQKRLNQRQQQAR